MSKPFRTVVAAAGVLLAAGAASSLDFDITADFELDGFVHGILSAEDAVAPQGQVTTATGSGRIAIRPGLGDTFSALIAAEGWAGDGFVNDYPPNQATNDLNVLEQPNADVALKHPDDAALTEAYITAEFGDRSTYTVSAGKVDVSGLFDVSDVASSQRTQFITPRFRNSAAIYYPGGEEAPRSVGAWVEFLSGARMFECTVGGTRMDADSSDLYMFAEGRVVLSGRVVAGLYLWRASGDFGKHLGPQRVNSFLGFGVFGDYEPGITGDLKLFGRLSLADQTVEENLYKASWSFGARVGGGPWGRPNDTVGGALGLNALSDDYARIAGLNANEAVFEGYYRFMYLIADRVSHRPSLEITPNFQMIFNPGGLSRGGAILWGVRVRSEIRF